MGYVFTVDSSCTNDDTTSDSFGDTCTEYYDAYPLGCGYYETSTFNSSAQCCTCGGGSTSSRRQLEWGGLSAVAEPELETEVTPIGSHDTHTDSTTYSYNYYYGYSYSSYSYSYYDYYYSSTSYSYSYYDYSSYDYSSYSYGYYDYYYGEYYDSSSSSCDCGSEP